MASTAIGIVLQNENREVLLVKRRDVPVWVLPGGGIDEGETAHQAVLREILEETGFQAQIIRKIAEYYPINRLSLPTFTFECRIVNGSPTKSDETNEVAFFPLTHLPDKLFSLHRDWIED